MQIKKDRRTMSDKNRTMCSDAVEKIIGNMTSEIQSNDGQYVPLGFSSPQNLTDHINWMPQSNSFMNYPVQYSDSHLNHPSREHFQQPQVNFIHQNAAMFEPALFQKNINLSDFHLYKNSVAPPPIYNNYLPENTMSDVLPESTTLPANHTHLIENLVGNWVVPNNSGTYTPFGCSETFKPNVFDIQNHTDVGLDPNEDMKYPNVAEITIDDKFNFNRDRKPRMVAEVKPMRPSYSDVLTKPVPSTSAKLLKSDAKETKLKKESKKSSKAEKAQKVGSQLSRSNTNNDIKDIPNDKFFTYKAEKKIAKTNQLNRKWASLDDISEPSANKIEENKKKKQEENVNRTVNKPLKNKINKTLNNIPDFQSESLKPETYNITKNNLKKNKISSKQKQGELQNVSDRPTAKRTQRNKKKENHVPFALFQQKIKHYTKDWWKVIATLMFWLLHLISDICSLSVHLGRDFAINSWTWITVNWTSFKTTTESLFRSWKFSKWIWEKFKGKKKTKIEEEPNSFLHNGLDANINMPTTGDEAMKRLLACKGKDPYSILGVTPTCTDDDIKKYYKRQAFLVHPDKNNQPGAEEAFKILVHAFDMIGTAERREAYDRGVAESAFMVQNFSQMAELLQRLQQKMEMNANTIRCSSCGDRHKRTKVERPSYAARNCNMCKIHHAAREGDIWAEARCFGFVWHYFACMEGSVYDITDWAGCQKETLKHLKPDSHHVQYRIALGKQNNQPRRNSSSPRMDKPDLENLLNSLYGHSDNLTSKRKTKNKK
ncbi:uncharacterized protein LOC132704220 [Cylas formicarius]|uniref:uncharacterized protein LOC132704220 n=1 Tax=Cylas formicarius TaxID=197179 RepID=UPI002958AFB2|nr:uncharacterized protein LOC132704220 [Cylas formicarius]